MTPLTYAFVLLALVPALFFRRIRSVFRRRRISRRYGCAPPARYPCAEPLFNFDLTYKMVQWVREGRRVRQMALATYAANNTIEILENGKRMIWTTDHRNAKAVLTTNFGCWGMGPRRSTPVKPLMGMGILTLDGEQWAHSRRMIKPTFNRGQVSDRSIFEVHFDRFLKLLPRDGSTVELSPFFSRLILDAGSQFVFGESTETCLPDGSGLGRQFKSCIDYAQVQLANRAMLGPFAVFHRDPKIQEACDTIHSFVDICIARAARSPEKRHGQHVLVYDLLDQISDGTRMRSELLHVFFGATDTSSTVLTNAMFLMARHPEAWAKLREEVKDLRPEDLSFEGVKSLKYVQWVIKEVLRLHSPAPTTTRVCCKATTLPFGGGPDGSKPVAMAPGDFCNVVIGGIHRRRDVYGADADEFRPERWAGLRTTWDFIPFLGGPRVCPGQQLALFWVAYALARLAAAVERVENRDEVDAFVDEQGISVRSRNGAKVALRWA